MCGIAGVIGPVLPDRGRINRTFDRMANRGPDYTGEYQGRLGVQNVLLLHSRLSIIDLDPRSNQPMKSAGCVLVFNGELYNYLELKTELESFGARFETNSDSEVIIQAYHQWGDACVDKFEGMWAFALLDTNRQRVFLSRDPFGEKPFYYATWGGVLYFGSEVKYLAALAGRQPDINYAQVRRLLAQGYQALYKHGETYFNDVIELPPASNCVLEEDLVINPKVYWRPRYAPETMSMEDAMEGAREHLFDSMRIRLRADVPLVFRLSGGVDSTFLAGLAAYHFGRQVHSYSIIDGDSRYNERENIDAMVSNLEADHRSIELDKRDFLPRMRELVGYFDAPVVTITFYLHSLLSEAIHNDGYRVSFSGTGADELFTGYYDHYSYWLAEMAGEENYPELLEEWRQGFGAYVQNPVLKDPSVFVRNPDERSHIFLDTDFFRTLLNEQFTEQFSEHDYTGKSVLRNRMLNELRHEKVPVILHDDDLSSMRCSIENRSPFLDRRLTDFIYKVPSRHLIHSGQSKWLLRAAGDGLVPDSVRLDKQKRGFNASILSLLDTSNSDVRDELLDPASPIFDLVKRDEIGKYIDGDLTSNSFSKFLFSFVSAKMFLETQQQACC